jgi:CRISPR-associated protein Csb3
MKTVALAGCPPHRLLSHLALYGLAAICQDAGRTGIALSWPPGMATRPCLTGNDLDEDTVASIVQHHARVRTGDQSWLYEDTPTGGAARPLMSPRISTLKADQWVPFQLHRHRVLDSLTRQRAELDLRLIGALGEPAYWRVDEGSQDDGASRLEMQPRNQGSEFVGTKLRKLAKAVTARDLSQVRDGLTGRSVIDEAGNDLPESRSATGLDGPGPVDNALVWCALWGISQFPLALRVRNTADTAGHVGDPRRGTFYVPMWSGPWRPARLRSILASRQLLAIANPATSETSDAVARREAARQWLAARSVVAVVRFGVRVFGTGKAPERRAGLGETIPMAGVS